MYGRTPKNRQVVPKIRSRLGTWVQSEEKKSVIYSHRARCLTLVIVWIITDPKIALLMTTKREQIVSIAFINNFETGYEVRDIKNGGKKSELRPIHTAAAHHSCSNSERPRKARHHSFESS